MFPKDQTNLSAYAVDFFKSVPHVTGEVPEYWVFHLSNSISTDLISYRQFFPYVWMVNNPISYAAIMPLWHVALPGFIIIWNVSGIVNVMCLVMPAAACLLIFGSLESSVCSVMSRLQNAKSHYQYVYWKVLTAELLELWAIFLTCWSIRIFGVSSPY
jgi:hypothetical protein